MQLWTRGICLASSDVLEQPSLYGVDFDDTANPFDNGSVVPDTVLNLTPVQLGYIEHYHPPDTQ